MANANNRQVFDRYLTPAEERQLFKTVREIDDPLARRDYAWMRFFRYTMTRLSVLAGKRKTAKADGSTGFTLGEAYECLKNGEFYFRPDIMKGSKSQTLYMSKNARKAVQDLIRARKEMGLPQDYDSPLVMSQKRNGLSSRQFQERMAYWCDRAGVKGSPHWLRHTGAKRVMKDSTAQDPRAVVQVLLNQDSINSTTVYTAPDKEEIALIMEEVL